jgi:hypothetical protein
MLFTMMNPFSVCGLGDIQVRPHREHPDAEWVADYFWQCGLNQMRSLLPF